MAIELQDGWRSENIRKAIFGSVFVCDYSAANATKLKAAIDSLFDDEGNLEALPTDPEFYDLGFLTTDGVTFSRDMSQEDVMSWQSVEATRSDNSSDSTSIRFTCQETNASVIALAEGLKLDDERLGEIGTGTLKLEKSGRGDTTYRTLIAVAQDGEDSDARYIVKVIHRARVTSIDDEQWQRGESMNRGFTLAAFKDDVAGTSITTLIDGPGTRASVTPPEPGAPASPTVQTATLV